MPNDKTKIAKQKAVANGFDPAAAEKVFKMANDKVAYMAKVAGTPSMQMTPADRVMAEDPTTVKRPLYALESNKDLYTEVSKSGKTITYNTTKDGRPVIYSPGSAVPGNIMQRTSTSASNEIYNNPSYLKNIKPGGNAMNWLDHAYSGSNIALGEFKRQTSNQKREFENTYKNIDFSSSASTTNPYSGKPISFGDRADVDRYGYDTDSSIETIKNQRRFNSREANIYRSSEKVQKNINRAVEDWRSGSPASKLGSGIVEVTGNDKPQLLGSFAPNFVSGTPTKPKKRSYKQRAGETRIGGALRGIARGLGEVGEFVGDAVPRGGGGKTNIFGKTKSKFRNKKSYSGGRRRR